MLTFWDQIRVMKSWIIKNKRVLAGILFGAVIGYGYYHFVGCSNGECLISSKPLNSTLYFGLMGGLLFSVLKGKPGGKAN